MTHEDIKLDERLSDLEKETVRNSTLLETVVDKLDKMEARLNQPRNNADWVMAGIGVISTCAVAIGLFVAPLQEELEEFKVMMLDQNTIQWERLDDLQRQVDSRAGVVEQGKIVIEERGKRLERLESLFNDHINRTNSDD